jgi:hypothetical protein
MWMKMCNLQDLNVHVREAARMMLRARRASVADGSLGGLPPEAAALLRLPEDSPGGVVTAAQLQQHATEVCCPCGLPSALKPGAHVKSHVKDFAYPKYSPGAVQLLVAAAVCLEQPAAVPPQLLAITASGRHS